MTSYTRTTFVLDIL